MAIPDTMPTVAVMPSVANRLRSRVVTYQQPQMNDANWIGTKRYVSRR
jgi:hypothetical protein